MSITRQFPNFIAGQTWDTVSARQMQNLVEAVKALVNLDVVRGSGLSLTANGTGFVLGENAVKRFPPRQRVTNVKRVAIVKKPGSQDLDLQVREVVFAGDPDARLEEVPGGNDVRPASLAFADDQFTAYAYPGTVPQDYDGAEVLSDTPGSESEVFDARQQGTHWIVEKMPEEGSGGLRTVNVVDSYSDDSQIVGVQEVARDRDPDSETFGAVVNIGQPFDVEVWPNSQGRHWAQHVNTNQTILLIKIDGEWQAMQTLRFVLREPMPTAVVRECG